MKKLIAVILCLVLLTGCGSLPQKPLAQSGQGTAGEGNQPQTPLLVYSCTSADAGLAQYIQSYTHHALLDGQLYILGTAPSAADRAQSVLLRMAPDGSGLTQLPLPLEPVDPALGESTAAGIAAAPDGTLALLQLVVNYQNENADPVESARSYYLHRIDRDGALLSSHLLDLPEHNAWLSGESMACTPDGTVWMSLGGKALVSVSPDGKCRAQSLGEETYLDTLTALGDGSLLVTAGTYDENGTPTTFNARWDAVADALGPALPFPEGMDAARRFTGQDGALYLYDAWGIYAYDEKNGTAPMVCSWLDSDIDYGQAVLDMAGRAGESFVALGYDDSWTSVKVSTLTWVDPATLPQKTVLTLAASYAGDLRDKVLAFNRASDSIRITLRDYAAVPGGDGAAAAAQLNSDIVAGTVPDILLVDDRLPFYQYERKGLFIDLYPLLDADPDLDRADLLQNVLAACEYEGRLTSLVPTFTVRTMAAPTALVGSDPGWSWEQFGQVLDACPDSMTVAIPLMSRAAVLAAALQLGNGQFVDYAAGTASFDSPAFCLLLQHLEAYPQPYSYADDPYGDYLPAQRIADRVNLLQDVTVRDPGDARTVAWQMGEAYTFKGMPTASGSGGSAIVPGQRLAISSTCADPNAAWQFLRTLLSEESQTSDGRWLPLRRSALADRLNYALAGDADPNGRWTLEPVAAAEADKIMALITTTDTLALQDEALQAIVLEEADAYFAGAKTAADTAFVIQDRVTTYLQERR